MGNRATKKNYFTFHVFFTMILEIVNFLHFYII
jgi:hypothetical protein